MPVFVDDVVAMFNCDVNKPVAIILCDNANMQMHIT